MEEDHFLGKHSGGKRLKDDESYSGDKGSRERILQLTL